MENITYHPELTPVSRPGAQSDTVQDYVPNPSSAGDRAQRLIALKEARGWTWPRVADEIGVGHSTVESWIYRGVLPSEQHRRRLAEVFRVSVEYIETGEQGEPAVNEVSQLADRFGKLETAVGRLGWLRQHDSVVRAELTEIKGQIGELAALLPDLVSEIRELREEVSSLRQSGEAGSRSQEGS